MEEKQFYKMLTAIHNAVSKEMLNKVCEDCYGDIQWHYNPTYVAIEDKNYITPAPREKWRIDRPFPEPTLTKAKKPQDYIGNIIRKYVTVKGNNKWNGKKPR